MRTFLPPSIPSVHVASSATTLSAGQKQSLTVAAVVPLATGSGLGHARNASGVHDRKPVEGSYGIESVGKIDRDGRAHLFRDAGIVGNLADRGRARRTDAAGRHGGALGGPLLMQAEAVDDCGNSPLRLQ